jgi:hypothetical protein
VLAGGGIFEPWKQTPDLLFRNERSGEVMLWQMAGSEKLAEVPLHSEFANVDWQLLGTSDLDKLDQDPESVQPRMHELLWHNASKGVLGYSVLAEGKIREEGFIDAGSMYGWQVVGIADFSGEGQRDLLWTDGRSLVVTTMAGRELSRQIQLERTIPPGFAPAGVGGVTDGSRNDIVFANGETGEVIVWQMNGFKFVSELYVSLPF